MKRDIDYEKVIPLFIGNSKCETSLKVALEKFDFFCTE